ncbi:MAG: hypothetical protein ACM3MH_11640 [Actinomycetota bacterium]
MQSVARLIVGALLVAAVPSLAQAQGAPAIQVIGGTTITLGGGLQQLALPDMNFTFKTDAAGAAVKRQTNGTLDNVGGAFTGSIETPFGYWGGTPVTGVASGFFANVSNNTRRKCISSQDIECEAENIIDNPNKLDSFGFSQFKTNTDRNVDYWGGGGEARFGRAAEPVPDTGGYLFRFAYFGIGGDVRGINQDNTLRLTGDGFTANSLKYNESLDTTYAGAYLSLGGEYNILGYLGMGSSWGLRSAINLRAGVYDASTDYSGAFTPDGGATTRLGLSKDQVAFIGAASFETRKQLGPRTSLSLVTDYEYYSYAPQMKYVNADVLPNRTFQGSVTKTNVEDSDAFEVRTTLRLNIALGAVPAPVYNEPLK